MSEQLLGKWVVVRSDRLMLSVDKADHLYSIGRSRQLPPSQFLSHKYASREQLAVMWHPPHLYIAQRGRNPSFLSPTCEPVPRLSSNENTAARDVGTTPGPASELDALSFPQQAKLRFTPSANTTEAVLHKDVNGWIEVHVPLSDPLAVTQAPDRHAITDSTLYFPDELGLPSLAVRFESANVACGDATAAATTKTVEEMLAVPAFGKVEDDEDEELSVAEVCDKSSGTAAAGAAVVAAAWAGTSNNGGNSKAKWRGLLDIALQEQWREEALQTSARARPSSHPVAPSPPPPVSAPSASIPFGSASEKGIAVAAAVSTDHHTMGYWEWKQHANGRDDDPKSWRKYNRAVTMLLEKAYCDPSVVKVKIPDSAMFDKPDANGSTYGVCFAEKALGGAMIQYSLEEPHRFRVIRRTGGPPVDRTKAKRAHVIPSSSSSSDSESDSEGSFSEDCDSSSEESLSPSSGDSSESEREPRKKKRRN